MGALVSAVSPMLELADEVDAVSDEVDAEPDEVEPEDPKVVEAEEDEVEEDVSVPVSLSSVSFSVGKAEHPTPPTSVARNQETHTRIRGVDIVLECING